MTATYTNQSARRAANTTSANVPGACQTQPDLSTESAPMLAFRLTPARRRALVFMRQRAVMYPGEYHLPAKGDGRICADLVRAGYLEASYDAALADHWRHRRRVYRLTDAGYAVAPGLVLPPPVVTPHEHRMPAVNGALHYGLVGQLWVDRLHKHADGTAVTIWRCFRTHKAHRAARGLPTLSPERVARDVAEHLRLADSRLVIEDARAVMRRGGCLVRVTFHLAGEPILLLPAGEPVPPPAVPVATWSLELAPEVDESPRGQWGRLTPEAQAVLVTLSRAGRAMPVRGASDVALKALDHELLIFRWPQLQEARISSRGMDLVEAMTAEGEIWSEADHAYAVGYVAAGSAEYVRQSLEAGS